MKNPYSDWHKRHSDHRDGSNSIVCGVYLRLNDLLTILSLELINSSVFKVGIAAKVL